MPKERSKCYKLLCKCDSCCYLDLFDETNDSIEVLYSFLFNAMIRRPRFNSLNKYRVWRQHRPSLTSIAWISISRNPPAFIDNLFSDHMLGLFPHFHYGIGLIDILLYSYSSFPHICCLHCSIPSTRPYLSI